MEIPAALKKRGIKGIKSNLKKGEQLDVGGALWLFFGDEMKARCFNKEADDATARATTGTK